MRKAPAPTPSDAGPSTNDEYLSIFSRRKEMETVIERDRRKRLQKKERREQKQVEERRRSSEKRSASAALDTSEPGEEVLEAEYVQIIWGRDKNTHAHGLGNPLHHRSGQGLARHQHHKRKRRVGDNTLLRR